MGPTLPYYAGPQGDGAANLRQLVEALHDTPLAERTARFICVLVLVGSDGSEAVFEGRCEGTRTLPNPIPLKIQFSSSK